MQNHCRRKEVSSPLGLRDPAGSGGVRQVPPGPAAPSDDAEGEKGGVTMTILLKERLACWRCGGFVQEGPDGPECLHCGRSLAEPPTPPPVRDEDVELLARETVRRDTGCVSAPSCLRCPLPRCKEDLAGGPPAARRQLLMLKNAAVIHTEGLRPKDAAERYGVSVRAVQRWLRFAKAAA